MKRFVICTWAVLLVSLFFGAAWAQERKLPEPAGGAVAVLDKTSFVVVRDRGPDNYSVVLYEVVKGRIRVVDAVRVSGDFTGDPPIVRYVRSRDIKEQ
jgi:hypothetical protein